MGPNSALSSSLAQLLECVQVLVVADSKTPTDWHLDGAEFLSIDEQAGLRYEVKDHIGYNTYA